MNPLDRLHAFLRLFWPAGKPWNYDPAAAAFRDLDKALAERLRFSDEIARLRQELADANEALTVAYQTGWHKRDAEMRHLDHTATLAKERADRADLEMARLRLELATDAERVCLGCRQRDQLTADRDAARAAHRETLDLLKQGHAAMLGYGYDLAFLRAIDVHLTTYQEPTP